MLFLAKKNHQALPQTSYLDLRGKTSGERRESGKEAGKISPTVVFKIRHLYNSSLLSRTVRPPMSATNACLIAYLTVLHANTLTKLSITFHIIYESIFLKQQW